MDIRPIRTEQDYDAVVEEIGRLWGSAAGTEDSDKLDILVTLVDRYEDARWPTDDAMDPIDLLHFAIDELGHTQAELAELFGSRPRASEVLNRKRPLSLDMIRRLHEAWKLPLKLLVKPYDLEPMVA